MTARRGTRHAMVLSGGGANGAYEIGVMKALFADEALAPAVYTGTSVGAFNAAVMASRTNGGETARQALAKLEEAWTGRIAGNSYHNGVFRVRADPRPFLDPRCYADNPGKPLEDAIKDATFLASEYVRRWNHFLTDEGSWEERAAQFSDLSNYISTAPFRRLVRDLVDPEKITRGAVQLRVAATSLKTGAVRVFGNADMDGDTGYDAVVASGSIPIVFPPHAVAGELFVDGAVRMNTPLSPAIQASSASGGDGVVLHVIVLDPGVSETPIPEPHNTLAMFDRLYGMLMSHAAQRDINNAHRINDAVRLRRIVEPVVDGIKQDPEARALLTEKGPAALRRIGPAWEELTRIVEHQNSKDLTQARHLLTIHRYRPHAPLSGVMGLLDFSDDNIARLIELGESDGKDHDCDRNHCVLARL